MHSIQVNWNKRGGKLCTLRSSSPLYLFLYKSFPYHRKSYLGEGLLTKASPAFTDGFEPSSLFGEWIPLFWGSPQWLSPFGSFKNSDSYCCFSLLSTNVIIHNMKSKMPSVFRSCPISEMLNMEKKCVPWKWWNMVHALCKELTDYQSR